MDPLVTLDGAEQLPVPEETTAGRIVAAGGSARASSASVTDAEAVHDLFEELAREHGRLDAVINVAGITRPSSYASGTEEDWLGVLSVHLDGYRNVLEAALPIMAAAGHGRILGVTSGSGWRAADAGAYSAAKRAVAALTWQLGRVAPPGVVVNAISPIAVTRMVTAALERAQAAGGGGSGSRSATGGLSLGSMPEPAHLGPLGAHLVGEESRMVHGPGDLRRRRRGGGHRPAPTARGRAHRRRRVARRRPRGGRAGVGPGRGRTGQRRRDQPPVRDGLRRTRRRPPGGRGGFVRDRVRPAGPGVERHGRAGSSWGALPHRGVRRRGLGLRGCGRRACVDGRTARGARRRRPRARRPGAGHRCRSRVGACPRRARDHRRGAPHRRGVDPGRCGPCRPGRPTGAAWSP